MSRATRATKMLEELGVDFTVSSYNYDPDAERIGLQAAEALGEPPERVLKTLMALVDGKPVCVIAPSDREVSMKKLAAAFGGKAAHMMKPADAERLSGYKVGGISPFGQMRKLPTAIEEQAMEQDFVFINGRAARLAGAAESARCCLALEGDHCAVGDVNEAPHATFSVAAQSASGASTVHRTPSTAKSSWALPPIACASKRSTARSPKPRRFGAVTGGPPLSAQKKENCALPSGRRTIFHSTDSLPLGAESAPYFVALVASSCIAMLKLVVQSGGSVTGGPFISIALSPKLGPSISVTRARKSTRCSSINRLFALAIALRRPSMADRKL